MLLKTSPPFHCPERCFGPASPPRSHHCPSATPARSEHPTASRGALSYASSSQTTQHPGFAALGSMQHTPTVSSSSVPGSDKATGEGNLPSHVFSSRTSHFQSELDWKLAIPHTLF